MEWVRVIFLVAGRIMTGLLAGVGLGLDVFGGQVVTLAPNDWGKIGFIAFLVFAGLTIWREIDLALQRKPKIEVKPVVYNNRAILKVHNSGGDANFTIRATVSTDILQPEPYYMCWDSITGIKCHIDKDGDASILVGSLSYELNNLVSKHEREFVLYKMGDSGKEKLYLSSPEVNEQIVLSRRYPTMPTQVPEEKCIIEVKVTSKPSPIKAFQPQRYLLKVDHTSGEILIFSNESNHDKGDSRI